MAKRRKKNRIPLIGSLALGAAAIGGIYYFFFRDTDKEEKNKISITPTQAKNIPVVVTNGSGTGYAQTVPNVFGVTPKGVKIELTPAQILQRKQSKINAG